MRRQADLLQGAKNLLFPVQCAGCGKWDSELCGDCRRTATRPIVSKIIEDAAGYPSTELLCLGDYAGVLRSIILTAKHDRYRDYSEFLFEAGTHLGRAVGQRLAAVAKQPMLAPLWIVPAPSSHARRRRRAEVVPTIAEGVAEGVQRELVARVVVVPAVALHRGVGGQSGRSAGSRSSARLGGMDLVIAPPRQSVAVVVDDVVTTGTTMRGVLDVLGGHGVLAVALAAA